MHYWSASIGLGVLTDLRGPLALQLVPAATSGARICCFVRHFIKLVIYRSFACFNNGLRVGWVYEVIFVYIHQWIKDDVKENLDKL